MTAFNVVRPIITHEATILAPGLHDVMGESLPATRKRLRGIDHQTHPAILPMLLRADVRDRIEKRALPEGWVVGGEPRQMEQLLLVNPVYGFTMHFLKERRRTYRGGVPVAGPNGSRRRIWNGPSLDLPLPGLEFAGGQPAPLDFLLLWDLINPLKPEEGYTLRLVHPTSPGVYGRAVPCDLALDLLPTGDIFDHLAFVGADENSNLFASTTVDIAESDPDGN